MTLDDLWGHTLGYEKCVSLWCWHSLKVFKKLDVKRIIYPYVTFLMTCKVEESTF